MQSTHLDEAPSSLSRLWPDPSDAIKALTRRRPPRAKGIIAATTTTSRVEFRGPIEVGGKAEVGKNERQRMVENPLWQSALEGKECPNSYFGNANDLMTAMARPLLVEVSELLFQSSGSALSLFIAVCGFLYVTGIKLVCFKLYLSCGAGTVIDQWRLSCGETVGRGLGSRHVHSHVSFQTTTRSRL